MPSNPGVTLQINLTTKDQAKLSINTTEKVISMAVKNVAFAAARNRQRKLKANIHRDFAPVVERELQNMARDVARLGIGLANPNNPPPGQLSIGGRVSKYMIGQTGPMAISSMTGTWAVRTKAYMKQKVKKYRTRKWFKNTGRLESQLRNVGTYRAAYGPVSVQFIPTSLTSERSSLISNLGRSSGGQSANIMIGRLQVSPMRRLSMNDLPGLGQKANYNERLLSPLADSVERKLAGRPGSYRPVLEPFLAYYMMRKIPNAVLLKLEDSLS